MDIIIFGQKHHLPNIMYVDQKKENYANCLVLFTLYQTSDYLGTSGGLTTTNLNMIN